MKKVGAMPKMNVSTSKKQNVWLLDFTYRLMFRKQ